jgi:hypothetical protein
MNNTPPTDGPLSLETPKFSLVADFNKKNGRYEIQMRSRVGGKNYSRHTHFNLLADDGAVIERREITPEIATYIFDNFRRRGDTHSFEIYEHELSECSREILTEAKVNLDSVRHSLTINEHSFTATGAKLAYHAPIFHKYRDTGFGSIIRATMTLHQRCASKCQYCSTILRNRADSISLEEAKAFVLALYEEQAAYNRENFAEYNQQYKDRTGSDIRLRGLILSGGGQPNLWPHFAEFVDWLSGLDIDLGLITNGFPTNVPEDIYTHFKWIRISITPEDASPHYPDGKFDQQYLPSSILNNAGTTTGYSYVYGPWSDEHMFSRIDQAATKNGFDYCRVLVDCNLTRTAQIQAHRMLSEHLFKHGLIDAKGEPTSRIFHQLKYHGTQEEAADLWDDGQCYLQTYNVFWDTTGHEENGYSHCYPCDSVTVLAEEGSDNDILVSERRFNPEKWGLVTNTRVAELYTRPVAPTFDPRSQCSACLFMRNNRTVKELSASETLQPLPAEPIQHVNFP